MQCRAASRLLLCISREASKSARVQQPSSWRHRGATVSTGCVWRVDPGCIGSFAEGPSLLTKGTQLAMASGLAEIDEVMDARGDFGTEAVEVVIGSWSCVDGLLGAGHCTTRPQSVVFLLDGETRMPELEARTQVLGSTSVQCSRLSLLHLEPAS